jgi:predicted small lipoprotein YifL
MKMHTLLPILALAATLAACGTDAPTSARPPERAALDGSTNPPPDTTLDDRGGSFGPGH